MRMLYNYFISLLFVCFVSFSLCRSLDSESDDGALEEAEYDEINEAGEELNDEDSEARIAENEEEVEPEFHSGHLIDFRGNAHLQKGAEERSVLNKVHNIPGKKHQISEVVDDKLEALVDTQNSPQIRSKMGMINKYISKFSALKDDQKKNVRDNAPIKSVENIAPSTRLINSRKSIERYDPYNNNDKKDNDYEKIFEEKNAEHEDNMNDELNYRNRRDVTEKSELDEANKNNDDESIIKKHLKRLSDDELSDLLKSLSDSKRDLLKKIIENSNPAEVNVNKRDITKKAGAVEDNNYNENSRDSCRVESEKSKENLPSLTSERLLVKKDANSHEDFENHPLSAEESTTSSIDISTDSFMGKEKTTSQFKRKRDAYENLADFDEDTLQKLTEEYSCHEAEEYSALNDYESNAQENNIKKRETLNENYSQISDTIKSLEESFPKINSFESNVDNTLIRVKRTNNIANKRSAPVVPDDKASYFPYGAENDDNDNKEGSEFDDEGFYDRISNLVKNEDKQLDVLNAEYSENDMNSMKNNLAIGSDTDNILNNMEGVDENIMFNNRLRSRRSPMPNADSNEKSSEQ